MFIWIGCKLPEDFAHALRQYCLEKNEDIGLDTVAFELPQHISLKISFRTEAPQAVLDCLRAFASRQKPFSVGLSQPEEVSGVLWLPVEENETLRRLHQELDALLEEKFGIPQHPFDKIFAFHSTLFLDKDQEKLGAMARKLESMELPEHLLVDTFLLGMSPDGKPGTCQIVDSISVT